LFCSSPERLDGRAARDLAKTGEVISEVLMIDMSSGAILAKFPYIWTFDAVNNWPILKSVD